MADRDSRLGPWGIYSREGVERVGLKKALLDTADHLAFGLSQIENRIDRSKAESEIDRLRREARSVP